MSSAPKVSPGNTHASNIIQIRNRLYLSYIHAITIGEKKRGYDSKGEQGGVYGTAWREERKKYNYNLKF